MIRRVSVHVAVLLSYLGIALFHLRPLGWVLTTHMQRGDREDVWLHGWILNWTARALGSDPLSMFDSNAFFPYPRSLAYTTHFIGEAVPIVPLRAITRDPILLYNIAFLLSFVLAGWFTFLLVRHLTGNPWAAWVAGAFACWFPAKRWSLAHVNTITLYWVPLALWLLHRTVERPRVLVTIAAGVAVALASLSSDYYTFYFPVLLLFGLPLLPWASGKLLDRRRLAAIVGAGLVTTLLMAPIIWVYATLWIPERGGDEFLVADVTGLDVGDLFVMESWVWSPLLRPELAHNVPAAFFPGGVAVLLAALALLDGWLRARGEREPLAPRDRALRLGGTALLGLAAIVTAAHLVAHRTAVYAQAAPPPGPGLWVAVVALAGLILAAVGDGSRARAWRARVAGIVGTVPRVVGWYAGMVVLAWLLAFGHRVQLFGYEGPRLPYYWLVQQVPFLNNLRAPVRAGFIAEMLIAVLVGIGAAALLARLTRRGLRPAIAAVILVVLMQGEMADAALSPSEPPAARPVDAWLAERPDAFGIVELPQPGLMYQTARGQWLSTYHWKQRVTGHNGFVPPDIERLHSLSRPMLNNAFVEHLLAYFPVRYVLVDVVAHGDPDERALRRRLARLGDVLEYEARVGDVVVLRVHNGGDAGVLRRRFPRWMIRGQLRIELAEPVPERLDGARLAVRLGDETIGAVTLRPGRRAIRIDLPERVPEEPLPWLLLRVRDGREGLLVDRIRFVDNDVSWP